MANSTTTGKSNLNYQSTTLKLFFKQTLKCCFALTLLVLSSQSASADKTNTTKASKKYTSTITWEALRGFGYPLDSKQQQLMKLVTPQTSPGKQPIAIFKNKTDKPVLLSISTDSKTNSNISSMQFSYREVSWQAKKPVRFRAFTQADVDKILDSYNSPDPSSNDPKLFVKGKSAAERWQRVVAILPEADKLSIEEIRGQLGVGHKSIRVDETELQYKLKLMPLDKDAGLIDEVIFDFLQNSLQSVTLRRGLWVSDQQAKD